MHGDKTAANGSPGSFSHQPKMLDYDRTRRIFSWNLPSTFNFGADVVDAWARDRGRFALYWEDEQGNTQRWTFWDLKVHSNRLGNALRAMGVNKGDRVLIILSRRPEWQVAMIACFKIGAVPIPSTEMLRGQDIEYRAQHSGAKAVIASPEGAQQVDGVRDLCPHLTVFLATGEERPGWFDWSQAIAKGSPKLQVERLGLDDPAVLFYTSGTSGHPKGVLHGQRSLFAWRYQAKFWIDLGPDDLMWCTADPGWSKAGTAILFGPWSWGTPVLMMDDAFDPQRRLHTLEKYEVSVFCGSPTEYRYIVRENMSDYSLPALRHCVSAGEQLNPGVIEAWREGTGVTIHDGYGQTEALMMVHNYRCLPIKPGSMGKPLPGYEISVLDENGRPCGPGEEGVLAVRSPNPCLFLRYWEDPESTAAAYSGEWFLTGDQVRYDEDGYYWFVGRADDVIISSGYRIGPFEVENALITHPAVVESAAVGVPDPDRGEVVKAYVVLRPGYEPGNHLIQELQDHVKKVTAPYKYPRMIEFVDDLPKTRSGKIRRAELRQRTTMDY